MATKRRMRRARVTALVHIGRELICREETTMTTDLPAANLGELVASAINTAWRNGHDPVDMILTVTFG